MHVTLYVRSIVDSHVVELDCLFPETNDECVITIYGKHQVQRCVYFVIFPILQMYFKIYVSRLNIFDFRDPRRVMPEV